MATIYRTLEERARYPAPSDMHKRDVTVQPWETTRGAYRRGATPRTVWSSDGAARRPSCH